MTRRLLLATLGALLVLLGGALLWTPARVLFTTGLLIPELLPGFPFQPAAITGRAVVREPVTFQLGDGTPDEADVYRIPGGRKRGAVLLFLGVNPASRDDERVGLGGFCVGSSIAFVSAADTRIRDDVSFVNVFGGY